MKRAITILKIGSLLIFNSIIFLYHNYIVLLILFLFFIIFIALMKKPIYQRLNTIFPIFLLCILFQVIFNSSISLNERAILGFIFGLRLTLISLSVFLFLSITSLFELTQLFYFLPRTWLLLLIMTWYFIPGIISESEKIKQIQKSRGLNIQSWNPFKSLASLIIPLLHRVFQRSQTLSLTLLSRGYEE